MGKKKANKARRQESTKDLTTDSATDTAAEVDATEEESETNIPVASNEEGVTEITSGIVERDVVVDLPADSSANTNITSEQPSVPPADASSAAPEAMSVAQLENVESAAASLDSGPNEVISTEDSVVNVDTHQPDSSFVATSNEDMTPAAVEATTAADDSADINTVANVDVDDQQTQNQAPNDTTPSEEKPLESAALSSPPRTDVRQSSFSLDKAEPLSPIPPVAFIASTNAALLPATTPGKSLQRIPSIHTSRLSSTSSDEVRDAIESAADTQSEAMSPDVRTEPTIIEEPETEEEAPASVASIQTPTEEAEAAVESTVDSPPQPVDESNAAASVVTLVVESSQNVPEALPEVENPLQQAPSPTDTKITEQEEEDEEEEVSPAAKPEPIRDYVHTAPNAQATFLESPFGFLFCGCY